jgi:hypothetical protein
VILVALFDSRTTLGLVRLRMRHTVDELARLLEAIFTRSSAREAPRPAFLADADDEIDRLFR